MSSTSTDHKPYIHGYNQISHHEWRTCENSAAYVLPVLESLAARDPKLSMLDVGAGPGTITASFAKYMPEGTIIASDISDEVLAKAAAAAAAVGAKNISTQAASVYELAATFGEKRFDIVHASMVLSHLDAPVDALTQMLAVCKPGGVVAVREADLRMFAAYPDSAALQGSHRLLLEGHKANGGSIDAGVRLLSWALQAGVKREQVELGMGTWCYSTNEEREMWAGAMVKRLEEGAMRTRALELGLASEDDIRDMVEGWKTWRQAEDACHASMHGELLVRL